MVDKLVPKVRFKGFVDDWEQVQLKDVLEQTSINVNPKDYHVELWSLTVENGLTPKSKRYNREFLVKKNDKFKLVKKNQFIYNPMNMTLGAIDLNLTGKEVAVSGYYITMESKSDFDNNFLLFWMKSYNAIGLYKRYATGTLIEKQRIQYPTLGQIYISLPTYYEQNSIGLLLRKTEEMILLQQRQIDNYKKLKQGLLQKLFPVDGEKVPVLRFADFHDNWEQCKLGNYSKIITGGTPNTKRSEYWNPKEIPWTSSGEVNNKIINKTNNMISKLGFENSSAKWIKKNSILIALAGQGKTRGTVAINNINLTTNQSIASISTSSNLNYKFIFQNLNKRYNELRQISSGNGTRGGLNKKIISDIYVPYICLNEQEKIGNILNRMDSIITLQQDKLDYLQRLKSSFLQNLFI